MGILAVMPKNVQVICNVHKALFYSFQRAKIVSTTLALRTTKYLYNETEYIPWQVAINNLDYFILMFDRSEVYGPLQVSSY